MRTHIAPVTALLLVAGLAIAAAFHFYLPLGAGSAGRVRAAGRAGETALSTAPTQGGEIGAAHPADSTNAHVRALTRRLEALERQSGRAAGASDGQAQYGEDIAQLELRADEFERTLRRLETQVISAARPSEERSLADEIERLRRQVDELARPDSARRLEEMLREMQRSIDTLRSDLYRLKLEVKSLDSR